MTNIQNRGDTMSYNHFSTFEWGKIEELLIQGYSHRAIAMKLHRHHSSIDWEIKRHGISGIYRCEKTKGKFTKDLAEKIKKKLLLTWSPEQIAHTIAKGIVSFKTIYHCLYTVVYLLFWKNIFRHTSKFFPSVSHSCFKSSVG